MTLIVPERWAKLHWRYRDFRYHSGWGVWNGESSAKRAERKAVEAAEKHMIKPRVVVLDLRTGEREELQWKD